MSVLTDIIGSLWAIERDALGEAQQLRISNEKWTEVRADRAVPKYLEYLDANVALLCGLRVKVSPEVGPKGWAIVDGRERTLWTERGKASPHTRINSPHTQRQINGLE